MVTVSRLSDELRKANTKNLGVRDISRRAKEFGETLSPSNISNYLRGNHPERPPKKTLVAFAKVFDVPVSDLEEAATFTGREPFAPDPASDRLTPPQRAVLNELIRQLADANEKAGEGNADSPTPISDSDNPLAVDQDDGLGAFGGRARGDLDHESKNDGNGDNVYSLVPPPPASDTAAYRAPNRGKKQKDKQDEDAEGTQDPGDDEE